MSISRVVFLGDSITLGYGLEDQTKRFSSVFCQMTQWEEVNYGITGTLVAKAGPSESNGTAFLDRYETMEDGDFVVVFGGTNDYFWSDTDIYGEDTEDNKYFANAVKNLCVGLREKYPGKPIVFIVPYQQRGIGNYSGCANYLESSFHLSDMENITGNALKQYADTLCKVCAENDVPVLDLYHDFGIDIAHCDADFEKYTIDGCHPSVDGHRRIAEFLYEYCKNIGLL